MPVKESFLVCGFKRQSRTKGKILHANTQATSQTAQPPNGRDQRDDQTQDKARQCIWLDPDRACLPPRSLQRIVPAARTCACALPSLLLSHVTKREIAQESSSPLSPLCKSSFTFPYFSKITVCTCKLHFILSILHLHPAPASSQARRPPDSLGAAFPPVSPTSGAPIALSLSALSNKARASLFYDPSFQPFASFKIQPLLLLISRRRLPLFYRRNERLLLLLPLFLYRIRCRHRMSQQHICNKCTCLVRQRRRN